MPYLFKKFERVVQLLNNPSKYTDLHQIEALVGQELTQIIEEELIYEQELLQIVASGKNPKSIKHTIRINQIGIIRIMDTLEKSLARFNNESLKVLVNHVIDILVNALHFICQQLKPYMDKQQVIPQVLYNKFKQKLCEQLPCFERYSQSLYDLKAIYHPYLKIAGSIDNNYTFGKICYLENTLLKLNECLSRYGCSIELLRFTVSYNLNSKSVFDCIISFIKERLGANSNKSDRIRRLRYLVKMVSQVVEIDAEGLNKERSSLKKLIVNWLKKEIGY
ncbi:hypothetical protein [Labilibacter marinus]|uniref:hypothetical protein n=1 Tax=Labilibacter marinus TaxID=1477105 RepID=UPI00094F65E0|nr:hypothetical protein [Labilibacter marinus]